MFSADCTRKTDQTISLQKIHLTSPQIIHKWVRDFKVTNEARLASQWSLKFAAEMTAAERNDGVSSPHTPEHARMIVPQDGLEPASIALEPTK